MVNHLKKFPKLEDEPHFHKRHAYCRSYAMAFAALEVSVDAASLHTGPLG